MVVGLGLVCGWGLHILHPIIMATTVLTVSRLGNAPTIPMAFIPVLLQHTIPQRHFGCDNGFVVFLASLWDRKKSFFAKRSGVPSLKGVARACKGPNFSSCFRPHSARSTHFLVLKVLDTLFGFRTVGTPINVIFVNQIEADQVVL